MAKKFDTNPLDPGFPDQAKAKVAETTPLSSANGSTVEFADPAETEEQTRKFNDAKFRSFKDSFGMGEGPVEPVAQSSRQTENKNHNIGSISLPENVLLALPYAPFMIGLIAGLIELFFIPKSEPKVRFHAAQGVAAHIGILIVTTVLGFASIASDLADVASGIFSLVTTIMLIIFAVKAWQGKPIHIEMVQDLTDWLEEKISPQK